MLDSVVPDLAAAPAVRKRRASKHDFKDGKGKVFAHKHDNGGGWVADTAYVAPSVRVTRNAEVFDYAKIYDNCEISGHAKVSGRARLFDNVALRQTARVMGNARLFDHVTLNDSSVVNGNARLGGHCTATNRVMISDNAHVYDTYMQGPIVRGELTISGGATVEGGRIYGFSVVTGGALVLSSTLQHVFVNDSAKLCNANVSTAFDYRYAAFLTRKDGLNFFPNQDEGAVLIETARQRLNIECALLDSQFQVTQHITLRENLTILNSRLFLVDTESQGAFFDELAAQEVMIYNLDNCRSLQQLRQWLAGGSQPRPINVPGYVPPAAAQTAPAPNLELIRQRRLMRLEGDNP